MVAAAKIGLSSQTQMGCNDSRIIRCLESKDYFIGS